MRSGTWSIVAIAVLGLVLAVALGIFANTIARGTVALPSTNLERSDARLAPAQAVTRSTPAPKKPRKRHATTITTNATTASATTTEADDDHGGRRSGRGSDNSGSGTGGSGKSDDHPHAEDD